MATMPIASFRPTAGITRASAASPDEAGMRKGPSRRQAAPASGANWWAPIFGWGAGPDYITGGSSSSSSSHASGPDGKRGASDDEDGGTARGGTARATAGGGSRGRMAPPAAVVFTEEKARMLRMRTAEASTFHDVMYHSAIASRLASDFHAHGNGQGQGHGSSGP